MTIPSPDPTPFHSPIRVEFKAPPPPDRPNGGATVYVRHPTVPVEWFRRMPTAGGTVYQRPVEDET